MEKMTRTPEPVYHIEFKGKKIFFVRYNEKYWISVYSVCDALELKYGEQCQFIENNHVLNSAFQYFTTTPGDNENASTNVFLPEEYICWWLSSYSQENGNESKSFRDCYLTVYKHFNGIVKRQTDLYREISKEKKRNADSENKLFEMPEYQEYVDSKMRLARLWKQARLTAGESDLFDNDEI